MTGGDHLATRADLDAAVARLELRIAELRGEFFRALWIQAGGIATLFIAGFGALLAAMRLWM